MATTHSTTAAPSWDFELCQLRDEIYAEMRASGRMDFTIRDAAQCALGQIGELTAYAAAWDADAAPQQPTPPATPAQRKAAYHLSQNLQVIAHAAGWLVPSGTRSNVIHFVNAEGTCSCEAGQHGRTCWHVAAVAASLQGRAA